MDEALGIAPHQSSSEELVRLGCLLSIVATDALFDSPRSTAARAWFDRWRHQLRHGQDHLVLASLTLLINTNLFTGKSFTTLLQVQAYFQRHHHLRMRKKLKSVQK